MFNYAGMATAELIDLLFREEDRVTREHIEELVRRGDEAKPRLREILLNEEYWYEGQRGEFWIELHAMVTLSLMRDAALLPDLISMIPHAYFSDQRWVTDRLPEILAQFGEAAVEPLTHFILENRPYHRDNIDYSFARTQAAKALTRIALATPDLRERVMDFLIGLLRDPQETDRVFLTQMIICPAVLDRKRGLQAVQGAFHRRVISESVWGKYYEFVQYLNGPRFDPADDLGGDLFEFYAPEAIAVRQERWATGDAAEEDDETEYDRAWSGPAPFPLPMERLYAEPISPASKSATAAVASPTKVGRNDPCPCGSGKKYKKCCGAAL